MEKKKEKKKNLITKIFRMEYNTFQKVISIFTMIYIPFIIILSYMIVKGKLTLLQYEYILQGITVINIFFIFIAKFNKYFKFNIADVFIFILTICAIVSTIFSVKPEVSLVGANGRNEGLLMILCYYSIFLVCSYIKDPKYKKMIILTFLFASFLQLREPFFRAKNTGLVGHHNFFGTYCLLVYSLATGMFIFNSEKKEKYLYLAISTIFFTYLVCCVTTSVVIGLFFVFIAIIGYIIILIILKYKGNLKKGRLNSVSTLFIKLFVVFDMIIICFILGGGTTLYIFNESNAIKKDFADVTDGKLSDDFGSQRGFIWKETLKIVPNYWVHGAGIDCLTYAFDGKSLITPKTNRIVDKAHNEYLQILVTEGVLSVVTYITFLLYTFVNSIKHIFKNETLNKSIYIPLFLAFIGYAIQAFANIRVTRVAPFFFIIFGLLIVRNLRNEKTK